ncbi:SAM hydrolase/SAM-dependent halogenase family protein [Leptolyngbya sp. GGD]|uniref:SAM hydrolase/SAM-dependent halogenase family protein n=1 Tax=Leptolyngbya sp. GGD TaxID=2997907 RepID=UPI00227AE1CE|nr:SAM-dependent chlorinase/fluorinase [Leptolyngbya sp. GGD]MCY6492939.1 SAM-dependent chlorinase/fluorinase [Leptolyngbya sp. GGD]
MIVTLMTDFGLSDAYVGVMKGTIAQINPRLQTIDLTHKIPPQDITSARFQLMTAYPYFPDGTVHVVVVDPSVGSSRRAIAVQLKAGFVVAPDNGLVSGILEHAVAAVELTNRKYWRSQTPSATFHGRDIFAPVGAHLASGVPLKELGDEIDLNSIIKLPIPDAIATENGIQGVIQAIDHFGNLITNIPGERFFNCSWSVQIHQSIYAGHTTYADAKVGEIIGLIGSHGWVEIAMNHGNAQSYLKLGIGTSIVTVIQSN